MTDESSGGEETAVTRDYEADARKMGWVPEEEFKGERRPVRFKTAQEFVEDTDHLSPHFKKLLDEQTKGFEERLSRLDKSNKIAQQLLERQFQTDLAAITAAQKVAAKDGDDEEFDRLEAVKSNLTKPDAQDGPPPAFIDFKERNPWYEADVEMAEIADAYSQKLYRDNPKLPFEDNLKKTEAKIKATFPDKFKPKSNGHANVDGGSENGGDGPRKTTKGWSDLPPEAKKAWTGFDDRIKKSLTQDKYAKQYWSDV